MFFKLSYDYIKKNISSADTSGNLMASFPKVKGKKTEK